MGEREHKEAVSKDNILIMTPELHKFVRDMPAVYIDGEKVDQVRESQYDKIFEYLEAQNERLQEEKKKLGEFLLKQREDFDKVKDELKQVKDQLQHVKANETADHRAAKLEEKLSAQSKEMEVMGRKVQEWEDAKRREEDAKEQKRADALARRMQQDFDQHEQRKRTAHETAHRSADRLSRLLQTVKKSREDDQSFWEKLHGKQERPSSRSRSR